MSRVMLVLGWMLACGCGLSGEFSQPTPAASARIESTPPVSAFEFNQTAGVITLNTRVSPAQKRRFDIGQGSVTLETIRAEAGRLTFHYTPEVEGGYTVYECVTPVSATPVTIQINPDGTPGDTSFDLSRCRVVRSGNLHLIAPDVGGISTAPGAISGEPASQADR